MKVECDKGEVVKVEELILTFYISLLLMQELLMLTWRIGPWVILSKMVGWPFLLKLYPPYCIMELTSYGEPSESISLMSYFLKFPAFTVTRKKYCFKGACVRLYQ